MLNAAFMFIKIYLKLNTEFRTFETIITYLNYNCSFNSY